MGRGRWPLTKMGSFFFTRTFDFARRLLTLLTCSRLAIPFSASFG
jgi:hypothetical protein